MENGNCSIIWPTEPIRGYQTNPGEVTHVTAVFLGPGRKFKNSRYNRDFVEQLLRSHGLNREPGYVDVLDYRPVGFKQRPALNMSPNKLDDIRADMVFWLSCVGLEPAGIWAWEPHVTLKSVGWDDLPAIPARLKLGKPIVWWKA